MFFRKSKVLYSPLRSSHVIKPDFHLNDCSRIDRFERIGRKGETVSTELKPIDRFDRIRLGGGGNPALYSSLRNSYAIRELIPVNLSNKSEIR